MAEERKTFPYKGRIIVSGPNSTGKNTIVGYRADQAEITRIKTQWGPDNVNEEERLVNITGYLNNDKNKRVDFASSLDLTPYQGITNAELISSIANDPNFYRTATGSQSPNTSTGQSSPDQQGGSTPTSEPGSTPIQPKGRGEPVTPGSGLRYPAEMSAQQDKIKFYAAEILPGGLTGEPTYSIKDGPIFLGIQGSISDQNSVDWGPDTVNAIDAKIFNAAKDIIKGTYIPPTEKQIYDAFQGNKNYIQTYLAGQAASLNNVLARTDNVILNPNLELLFQGPQLRPFSFQFKMSARDEAEATNIKQIINFFKKNMAVRGKNQLFLKAPYVFTIQYLRGAEQQHPSINRISKSDNEKACALTNCSVDYTPLGSYMTYDDPSGTMVSYTLSLQFQEITPVYQEDYDGHAIGY